MCFTVEVYHSQQPDGPVALVQMMEYLSRAEEIKGFDKGQQPVTAQLPSGAAQKARPKGNGDGGGGGGGGAEASMHSCYLAQLA